MPSSSASPFMQLVERINEQSETEFAERYLPSDSPLLLYAPAAATDGQHQANPSFKISLLSLPSILKSELKACFDLITETSAEDYQASQKGWKPRAKWREMSEPDMRYLLVRIHDSVTFTDDASSSSTIVAFLSFMITIEDDMPVLYIYEIHLSEHVRRVGLGAHLMKIAEHAAERTGMRCTMLTVFRRNERARRFYIARGYEKAESSPADRMLRGGKVKKCDYLILFKWTEHENNTEDQLSAQPREDDD